MKQLLGYIGRYIRRPAIAVSRIEEYDGKTITFRYRDKTDGKEKTEAISVEEFIARLIRHIPDENFKTIRYYGVYSYRIKALCKKLVSLWQKEARKWIVKAKQMSKRRTWSERVREQAGKQPCCPKCESYYEYKDEVCLDESKACLERMINDVAGIKEAKNNKEKEEARQGNAKHREVSVKSSPPSQTRLSVR